MIWFLYLTLVTLLSIANSEYYPEFSKKIFNVTSEHNSYFGYSIAYETQSKTLIVSAPLSNIVGDVFLCSIFDGSCKPVVTDLSSTCTGNKMYDGNENMWLGAVVKSAPSYYVTCAPRCIKNDTYVLTHFNKRPTSAPITTEGHCFIGFSDKMTFLKQLKPISDDDRYEYYTDDFKVELSMLSYGWSLDVFENRSIAIGGPAMASGRLEKYSRFNQIPANVNGADRGVNFNFGYSVASGYFIKNQDISYAVGSPYGTYGYGKVVLLSNQLINHGSLVKDEDYESSLYRVGAMYGSVLCTASFSGKMTDLLVGAPTYAEEHRQNTGAVYVYIRGKSMKPVYKRVIIGYHEKSYFGSAIVSIGDLNNDQKDEFAIAAPYEGDGRGAVYLYSGADVLKGGNPFHPLQRITPQDHWRTFGLSLASLQDYDGNGCNELAIGAPESDKVMLLRCMASVQVEVAIREPDLNNDKLNPNKPGQERSFKFESCLKVRYPKKPEKIRGTIEMKTQILHNDAKLKYSENAKYKVYLHEKKEKYCNNIEVVTPENGNYDLAIIIRVTATHIDDPIKERVFDSSRVVLADNSLLESDASVWAAECNGKRCIPDLKYITTEFSIPRNIPYVIGSSPNISATIWVKNQGQTAYDAYVHVHVTGASVLIAPAGCERAEERPQYSWLKCSPKQLIREGMTWNSGQIILNTTLLTNVDKVIIFEGVIFNHRMDSNNGKAFKEVIDLVSDANEVTVKGLTDFGTEVNMTKSDIATGKAFEHFYEISNNGPTTWVNIDYQIEVKQLPFIELYNVVIQNSAAESNCKIEEVKRDSFIYSIYKCKLVKLHKYPIVVVLPMRVKPDAVGDMLDRGTKMSVHSELSFVLQGSKKLASVTSTLTKRDASVPLWVLICTAFIGLLILGIIGLISRELGFLKRENKAKLDRVRQSVRRQTMKRQSQNQRLGSEGVNSEDLHAMLANAAKEKHDRRVRVPSTD